jgi:Ala-tRNA(Pro) deacylase
MSRVTDYLTDHDVSFQVLPHPRALTSVQEARALGVAADEVVKTVALVGRGGYLLAVVPASWRLDLRLVRDLLDDPTVRLAGEGELLVDFPGYELGALPPLGSLLGVRVLVDPRVLEHEVVVFAGGLEAESVAAPVAELFRDEGIQVAALTGEHDPNATDPVAELEGA